MSTLVMCNGCVHPSACREIGMCWDGLAIQSRCAEHNARVREGTAAAAPVAAPVAAPAPQAPPKPAAPAVRPPAAPAGPVARPAAGTTTAKVWELADAARAQHTGALDKEFRRAVIIACEQAGINGSTASVQYSRWLSTQA